MESPGTDEDAFEVLEEFTGADEDWGPLWPVEHRRESQWPEPEEGDWSAQPTWPRWLVRSPWSGLRVAEVVDALFEFLPGDYNNMYDPAVRDPIVAAFFRLERAQVLALAELHNSDD